MGIQINGVNDIISATDGSLSLPGADLTNLSQVNVTGVGTFANLVVTGNVSIAGTLTYEDVTNVDSIGIITARTGIQVLAGGINAVGIITATSFSGSGSGLTGIAVTSNISTNAIVNSGITTVAAGTSALPSISPTGDSNTGVFFPSADTIAFSEGGAEAARFDSNGRFGIGTASPAQAFHTVGNGLFTGNVSIGNETSGRKTLTLESSDNGAAVLFRADAGTRARIEAPDGETALVFGVELAVTPTERMRIDSSGRLLVGTVTARDKLFNGTTSTNIPQFQSERAGGGLVNRLLVTGNNGTVPANSASELILARSYGTTLNSYTAVTSADSHLGAISFQGADGTEFVEAASIQCFTDAACGANDMPGRLSFSVTADGASSPTERARIERNGRFSINYASVSGTINDYSGGIYSFHSSPNSNSTTLGDQRATWFIRGSVQNTNNDGANNILLLQDTGGSAINPGNMMRAYRGSTEVFRVSNDGSVRNNSGTYTTLSDERAKQDIIDASSAWDDVKSLRIRKFRLKSEVEHYAENPHLGDAPYFLGVIAQEVEQVCPNLVDSPKLDDGSPDPDALKGVKQSIIYMKAVKALQEAQERIETLETTIVTLSDRISALENP